MKRELRFWTEAEDAALEKLVAEGRDRHTIVACFPGRSRSAVLQRIERTKARLKNGACDHAGTVWDATEEQALLQMRKVERKSMRDCAKALGRTVSAVEKRLALLGDVTADQAANPEEGAQTDRDRRAGLSHSTITSAFFGDPLPGHSALDRRKAGA